MMWWCGGDDVMIRYEELEDDINDSSRDPVLKVTILASYDVIICRC